MTAHEEHLKNCEWIKIDWHLLDGDQSGKRKILIQEIEHVKFLE